MPGRFGSGSGGDLPAGNAVVEAADRLPVREGRVAAFHILLPATGRKRGSEEGRTSQISREGSRVNGGLPPAVKHRICRPCSAAGMPAVHGYEGNPLCRLSIRSTPSMPAWASSAWATWACLSSSSSAGPVSRSPGSMSTKRKSRPCAGGKATSGTSTRLCFGRRSTGTSPPRRTSAF